MNKFFSFGLNIKKCKVFIALYVLILTICTALVVLSVKNYNDLVSDFKIRFNNGDYASANSLAVSGEKYNPMKALMFSKDLKNYLGDFFNNTVSSYKNGSISENETLYLLSQVNQYGYFLSEIEDFKATLPSIKESINNYHSGLDEFNNSNFINALESFSKISEFDSNYKSSLNYQKESLNKLKAATLDKAESLASEKYYTDAINLIKSTLDKYFKDDKDISERISSYENQRADYLANVNNNDDSKAASALPSISSITLSNINSFNLTSSNDYLIYVNISKQKTYVFKGKKNNWNILKTFSCSTGKEENDTPTGKFQVESKGEWFYSEKYKQGAKYWIQFKGNYLFHSVPFEVDKTTVIDPSLGSPLSHGCVRLSLDDSKWLYDTVTKGTSIIIN